MVTVPILCYHKVGPEAKFGRRLNIEPERLDSHVRFFARRGFRFLTGKEFQGALNPKTVAFTFDDAFECTVTETNVIFDRHKALATHYVVAHRVGKTSDWDGEAPYPLADWNLLREAARLGHEIGNHTCSHIRLAAVNDERVRQEMEDAENLLQSKGLGGSFCYPYGSYDARSTRLVASLSTPIGMSLVKGVAREDSDRLLLPRVTVAFSDVLPMLVYKVFVRNRLRRPPSIVLNS